MASAGTADTAAASEKVNVSKALATVDVSRYRSVQLAPPLAVTRSARCLATGALARTETVNSAGMKPTVETVNWKPCDMLLDDAAGNALFP